MYMYVPVLTLPHTHTRRSIPSLRTCVDRVVMLSGSYACVFSLNDTHVIQESLVVHFPRSYLTQSSCILTENYLTGMTFSVTICVANHDTSNELCSNLKYVLVVDTHNTSVIPRQFSCRPRFMIQSIVMIVYVEIGASFLMTIIFSEYLSYVINFHIEIME